MQFDKFEIHAEPYITRAKCKCGQSLVEVSSGWTSRAMFCPKCENVYTLKLIKVPAKKLNQKFLDQCRKESTENEK